MKITEEEIELIRKATKYNLSTAYYDSSYMYLVNLDGTDAAFHGVKGNLNVGVNAPYIVCTMHSEESWRNNQLNDPTLWPSTPEEEGGNFVG